MGQKTHYLKNNGYSSCGKKIRPMYNLFWSWCWGSVDCKLCIKNKEKRLDEMIRKPVAPSQKTHKDKSKYNRKKKHKGKEE